MKKQGKRLMKITYSCTDDVISRLKSCFDMCCIKYVVFKEYGFTDGTSRYDIYIDKNKCTWEQVMHEVNRVKPTIFRYENGLDIKDGELYHYC